MVTLAGLIILQPIMGQASPPPNVVLFLLDDLGSGELECYARKFHETPNIDALTESGLLFTNAYSGHPWIEKVGIESKYELKLLGPSDVSY